MSQFGTFVFSLVSFSKIQSIWSFGSGSNHLFLFLLAYMVFLLLVALFIYDAPPSSLMDSTMSSKVTIVEGKGARAHSLVRNTFGVERRAGALGWDYED
jgi:hypothetical protein